MWWVSIKSFGVRLMFDISIELSTKKLLEKSRSFYFGVKWCLHRLENKRKNQIAKQSEFLWAIFLYGPFRNNVEKWIQLPLLNESLEIVTLFFALNSMIVCVSIESWSCKLIYNLNSGLISSTMVKVQIYQKLPVKEL